MSTELVPFSNGDYNIRTLEIDGDPWFVADDIAKSLGYRNANDMTRGLEDDEVSTTQIVRSTAGGNPNLTVISEPGLYHVLNTGRRPEVKPFQRWVNHEVLPAIRKTGAYLVAQEPANVERAVQDTALEQFKWAKKYEARLQREERKALAAQKMYRNPVTGSIEPLPGTVLNDEVPKLVEDYVQQGRRRAKKSGDSAFETPEEFEHNAAWNNTFREN